MASGRIETRRADDGSEEISTSPQYQVAPSPAQERKEAEARIRSQLDPALAALLSEHGLLMECGPTLIKEAGVKTLKELNELSVDDLVSVGISPSAASKMHDVGLKIKAQIKGKMDEISEKAGPCKVS